MAKTVPIIYEIQNFGASRKIPTHRGGLFLAHRELFWRKPEETDEQELEDLRSAPFVEVRKKMDLTGFTVRRLRNLAKKSRIKVSSKAKKSELLHLLGGVQCQKS
jgi:hypothetical protein